MGLADYQSFAQFASSRGVSPGFHPRHGAEALEILSLVEAAEEIGDQILHAAHAGRIDSDTASRHLEDLLKCYSNPLSNSRRLMQIRIEAGKLKR